jgi:hypothetical protein
LYRARELNLHRQLCAKLGGGKSSVAFCYRIVGARKEVRGHKRFAKIDIPRLLSAPGTRAPCKPASTAAGVRALVARAEGGAQTEAQRGQITGFENLNGHHEDGKPTHCYSATREAAMTAFAKSWRWE